MNLGVILRETARIHGSRAVILDDERSFTWVQLRERYQNAR